MVSRGGRGCPWERGFRKGVGPGASDREPGPAFFGGGRAGQAVKFRTKSNSARRPAPSLVTFMSRRGS
ncbi:hypothetical protein B005_4805 [Nocardiopsis alba ATCC BAA-2165]|uniref:Uncharacterized protein n=1 Tax=Nocardiopsis alba (strain ATCC BAA-2165 / BE74) TaxID=1205910 RepID=J7L4R4_NOCAA|nr:hypothetical protein B005_4805 [Nocardiopsis alba ATCC BAA-2165]